MTKKQIKKEQPKEETKVEIKVEKPKEVKKLKVVERPRTKKDYLYDMRLVLAPMIASIQKDMQQEGSNVYRNSIEVALEGIETAYRYIGVSIERIGGELPKGYREEINK